MPERKRRARRRAARAAALLTETRELHTQMEQAKPWQRVAATQRFVDHLRRVAATDREVWPQVAPLVAGLADPEDRADLNAIAAQLVNPRLAGMTPGSVHRQHRLGDA